MVALMSGIGRPEEKLDVPWSLRISTPDRNEAAHAGKRLRTNDQSAYRFAARIGFKLLRLIDYDVEGAIVEHAIRAAVKKRNGGKGQPP